MGEKKKQRSKNVKELYRDKILSILWRQKMQDMKFEELIRQGIIKEIKDD